jgi:hypothetical protein
MSTRLTESRLRKIIRQEINEMGSPLVSSDPEGSIAEPPVKGLKYQSAAAMRNAGVRLLDKLSTTKHPKTGLSYGATIISALRDPKYSMLALRMFNDFANKMGFNTDMMDDSIKRTAWDDLCTDVRTGEKRPGAIPWSRT